MTGTNLSHGYSTALSVTVNKNKIHVLYLCFIAYLKNTPTRYCGIYEHQLKLSTGSSCHYKRPITSACRIVLFPFITSLFFFQQDEKTKHGPLLDLIYIKGNSRYGTVLEASKHLCSYFLIVRTENND